MHKPSGTIECGAHQDTSTNTHGLANDAIANALDITVDGPSEELVDYIFNSEIGSKIEDAIGYALNNKITTCDAIMSLTPGQKRGDGWIASVGPLLPMDKFSFIQHNSMSKDIFLRSDFKKLFLSVHIQKIIDAPVTYQILPMILELPSKGTKLPNGFIFVKELKTIEEYTDAERYFL